MSLKSALGLESKKKVRYAIVALGDISQESLMPGVAHTGNSVITALVTGDPAKADAVAKEYDLKPEDVYDYAHFADLLSSGKIDALYLATPNWKHAEFAIPAIKAGIHVLLEKPMEITVALCQNIIDAQQAHPKTKLMIAYRLHFEPATLAVIDVVRAGDLGTIRGFGSTFSQPLNPTNHRAHNGTVGGPLFDMGPYPINAVCNLFGAEPVTISATGDRHPDSGLPQDFDDTVAVTLTFADQRIAQFTVSYAAHSVDTYTVYGTAGSIRLEPAYGFGKAKTYALVAGSGSTTKTFKPTDHFGGELQYFSECVLNDTAPEPDGEEGLLDVRVIEAAVESIKTGRIVALPPLQRSRHIDTAQVKSLGMVSPPKLVNTESPSMK